MKGRFILLSVLALGGCHAASKPPQTLLDADRTHGSPKVIETETSAPQAKASADALRKKAWQLEKGGQRAEASLVAEQASAAYELAIALGRRAHAKVRIERATELSAKRKLELATLEADQARLEGEIEALELRAKVQEDRQALGDEEKLTPERAAARRRAAFVLLREGEVLCAGARLLDAPKTELDPAMTEFDALAARLAQGSSERDVFPRASALRARCLKILTDLRAANSAAHPESAENDIFLEEATALALPAERDDRGLVVRLTDILHGSALSAATEEKLKKTAQLAVGHKDSPVLLVIHTSGQAENSKAQGWGDAAKKILVGEGASRVELVVLGHSAPLVSTRSAGAATMNRRLEVVFVTPVL